MEASKQDAGFQSKLKSFLSSLFPHLSNQETEALTHRVAAFGHSWATNYRTSPQAVERARRSLRRWIRASGILGGRKSE